MSHKTFHPFASLILVLALTFAGVSPAWAAPPSNDDFASATLVTEPLPFTDSINTSEATTAVDDPDCAGQGPTVWYAFTPSQDMFVQADTFGSDYDTTLSVYIGSQGALNQIACNDDAGSLQSLVFFQASANETYFLMVAAFGSGPGGNLVFTAIQAPPPLTVDLQLDSTGSFDKSGKAILRGTLTCSKSVQVQLMADVSQPVGKKTIHGTGGNFVQCDGETRWDVTVFGDNGLFAGGAATVDIHALAFDFDTGSLIEAFASGVVRLKGLRR